MTEREFTLKGIFNDVEKLEQNQGLCGQYIYSTEENSGVEWKIYITKNNKHLAMLLLTNMTGNQEIHNDRTMKIFSKNKEKNHSKSSNSVFCNSHKFIRGWHKFIEWRTLKDEYLDDGKLEVELHVKINKMVGFPREELRSFGEDRKQLDHQFFLIPALLLFELLDK